jgi:hypothetical protein
MEKIYSKVDGRLLHIINRLSEIEGRNDVVPEDNFIQCATLKMEKGKTFPPHKHIEKERIIAEAILYEGDASFTLYGGHTYEILEDDTIVYEYKTGPYEGQKLDKVFI